MTTEIEYEGLLGTSKRAPMQPDEIDALMALTLAEEQLPKNGDPTSQAMMEDVAEQPFPAILIHRLRVFAGRWEWADIVTPEAILMVASLHTSNSPGAAVVWAYTLLLLRVRHGEPVSLKTLADEFPIGFPTEAAHLEAWDAQKRDGINGLDSGSMWKPLAQALEEEAACDRGESVPPSTQNVYAE